MGIERPTLRFLVRCRADGVDFRRTVTVGRQDLLITAGDLLEVFARADGAMALDAAGAARILTEHARFADGLFHLMGADVVDSMDASGFEGATVVHDLNEPLPVQLREAYTAVVELGTLEHVFNFPQAIKNLMAMVTVGGHLVIVTPCNNFMGHGFYQFSPELFFRVLSPANGYRVAEMIYCRAFNDSDWYRVSDPEEVRSRVGHTAPFPSHLMIRAKREAKCDLLAQWPMQSDYAAEWSNRSNKAAAADRLAFFTAHLDRSGERPVPALWKQILKALTPPPLRREVSAWRLGRLLCRPPDSRFFEKTGQTSKRS